MKDINEFIKLFKVNIPYKPEWPYYIQTLSLSKEYKDLSDLVISFGKFEEWVEERGYTSVKKYKMECLDKIKEYVERSDAYHTFLDFDYSDHKFRTLDNIKEWAQKQGESDNPDYLLSFDLRSANYNIIKQFDGCGDLGESWDEMCSTMFIHPVLISSKSFRQVVFGNLNPKRSGKIQLFRMNEVADRLEREGHKNRIVSISNDEICLSLPSHLCDELGYEKAIWELFGIKCFLPLPTKMTVFAIKNLGSGMFKKVVLFQEGLDKENRYTTLSGIPGNKFYKFFLCIF